MIKSGTQITFYNEQATG